MFFQRLFGPITPSTNEFFEIPYPFASDLPELDSLIDEKINQLIHDKFNYFHRDMIEQLNSDDVKYGQLSIQFFDNNPQVKKKTGWFGQGKDHNAKVWESWIIQVKCIPMAHTESSANSINSDENVLISIKSFEANLNKINDIADTHKDHIPPITSLESSPFPYSIDLESKLDYNVEDQSWGGYIRKILD